VGYHYSFDIKMLHKEGMAVPRSIEDSMLCAHLLNENEGSFKMENVCTRYIDPDAYKEEEKLIDLLVEWFGGSRKGAKGNLWRMPPDRVADYACQDLVSTRGLRDFQKEYLVEWGLHEVADGVHDYQLAIAQMEMNGLLLDTKLIDQYIEEADKECAELETRAEKLAGYKINLRSSKQTQAWLEVASTNKEVLGMMIAGGDERAQLLLDYRIWSKVTGTYYRPFLKKMYNGHLHPNLSLIGTISGRLSCRAPNLQSIPRQTERYRVKDVFIAPPGYTLVEADYSQAEMRIATHYSQDAAMREILLAGKNVHRAVAEEQNMPYDIAKRLNFSVIYGIGARKFSKTYHVPYGQAKKYLGDYHRMFPGFRRLYNSADQKAQDTGIIRHYTGRLRHFNSPKMAPSHKASSNLIQGAVAEMMRLAITRLHAEVPEARQLLTVHDSILFEIPTNHVSALTPRIRTIMEDQNWCSLPLKVDMKAGPSWGQMKEL
jgi:DNA polymerase-1